MQCGSNLLASLLAFDFDGGAAWVPTSGLGASGGVGATSGRWRDELSCGETGVLVCPEADTRTTNSKNKIARTEYFTRLILMRSWEALRSNHKLTTTPVDRHLLRKCSESGFLVAEICCDEDFAQPANLPYWMGKTGRYLALLSAAGDLRKLVS